MAGFYPVGSSPVASVPAGVAGRIFYLDPGNVNAGGSVYAFSYTFALKSRASWTGVEVLRDDPGLIRDSFIGAEALYSYKNLAVFSLGAVEVLRAFEGPIHDSWDGVEVLRSFNLFHRTSFMATEVLTTGLSQLYSSWAGVEVLRDDPGTIRPSWLGAEVLRSIPGLSSGDTFISIIW